MVDLRETGCPGFCERGPIIVIYPEETCYVQVQPKDAAEIISETIVEEESRRSPAVCGSHYRMRKPSRNRKYPSINIRCGSSSATTSSSIPKASTDYLAIGGYSALAKALFEMPPDQIVEMVKVCQPARPGRRRISAGKKWESARNSPGDTKYVVVNADEGDPGHSWTERCWKAIPTQCLKDLSSAPMPSARRRLYLRPPGISAGARKCDDRNRASRSIRPAREKHSRLGFDFNVKIHRGAGAFVCGEETALLMSLEGKPGEPKPSPPYPRKRALGQTDEHQQRGDLGQCSPDHQQRGGVVLAPSAPRGAKAPRYSRSSAK